MIELTKDLSIAQYSTGGDIMVSIKINEIKNRIMNHQKNALCLIEEYLDSDELTKLVLLISEARSYVNFQFIL